MIAETSCIFYYCALCWESFERYRITTLKNIFALRLGIIFSEISKCTAKIYSPLLFPKSTEKKTMKKLRCCRTLVKLRKKNSDFILGHIRFDEKIAYFRCTQISYVGSRGIYGRIIINGILLTISEKKMPIIIGNTNYKSFKKSRVTD